MKLTTITASLLMMTSMGAIAAEQKNTNYVTYPEPSLIKRDLSKLDRVLQENYQKFISYQTPNGGEILLVATDGPSDEQLLRAHNILDFYLTNVPGSLYGADKTAVANAMAENGAVLVMPGGADGDSPIKDNALAGQPLYALEFPIEGSAAYINNNYDQRDAGFEEIFHMVHDYGIGTKHTSGALKSSYQQQITKAMELSRKNSLWGNGVSDWISELDAEGSLEQEYIASVIDSYFGYWGAWTEGDTGMWGIYAAKTREDVKKRDPMGAALIPQFLSENVTYMARIDPAFSGTFEMKFDTSTPYTHKSQYLMNARLLGMHPTNLNGNAYDNTLIGNSANNTIDGGQGIDVVQYPVASDQVQINKNGDFVTVIGLAVGTDKLSNIETLRFTDRDIDTSSL